MTGKRCSRVIGTYANDFLFCGNYAGEHRIADSAGLHHPVCDECWDEWQKNSASTASQPS